MHCALLQFIQSFSVHPKMAASQLNTSSGIRSASLAQSGVSPPKRGRPKNEVGITRIKLKKDVFETWVCRKNSLCFATKTHSEFAMHLLLNFYQEERDFIQSPVYGKPIFYLLRSQFLCALYLLYLHYFPNIRCRPQSHKTSHTFDPIWKLKSSFTSRIFSNLPC